VTYARRIKLWAMRVLTVLFLIGLVLCSGLVTMLWDGSYRLNVTIADAGERPKRVYCEAFYHGDTANRCLCAVLAGEQGFINTNAEHWNYTGLDPYEGGPIEVRIPLSGSHSWLFGELRDPQGSTHLMVAAEMPDGRRTGTVIRLPHYDVSKSVSVSLP
jgi:hypothetical protein